LCVALKTLNEVLERMQVHQWKKTPQLDILPWSRWVDAAIKGNISTTMTKKDYISGTRNAGGADSWLMAPCLLAHELLDFKKRKGELMKPITVEMPQVLKCAAAQCAYNTSGACHAKAITIGDTVNPDCDTFFSASKHARNEQIVVGVAI
jgi:hypothetical protein